MDEINWREKLSQIISPGGAFSSLFLQHSSMDSLQFCFLPDFFEELRIIKLPAINKAASATCNRYFFCIRVGFFVGRSYRSKCYSNFKFSLRNESCKQSGQWSMVNACLPDRQGQYEHLVVGKPCEISNLSALIC